MKAPETPKFTGAHRRCGRFGELSTFQAALAIILVLLALAILSTVLLKIRT